MPGEYEGQRARFVAPTDDRWRDDAACRDADTELFFPDPSDSHTAAQAIAICQSCPVIEPCLRDALHTRERYGIRGGLTPDRRLDLLAGQRRTSHHGGHFAGRHKVPDESARGEHAALDTRRRARSISTGISQ